MIANNGLKTLIIRYSGELTTKGKGTRKVLQKALIRNLREALSENGISESPVAFRERAFVHQVQDQAAEIASRVFGVQSASLAIPFEAKDLKTTVEEAKKVFAPLVASKTFAVRARLVGGTSGYEWSGTKLERELGTALLPFASRVNLSNPEFTALVETHRSQLFAVTHTHKGPAGLPFSGEGRALALVSGGYDSAVAAWKIMRRGVHVDFIFFNLGGVEHAKETLKVSKLLANQWGYGVRPRFFWLEFDQIVSEIKLHCNARYWQIVLKRLMFRASSIITENANYDALITGEAIGQVSSQTLRNLTVISEATDLTILRPLIGSNKSDIIQLSKHIGTEELSAKVQEYCALNRKNPSTSAPSEVIASEERLISSDLLHEIVGNAHILDIKSTQIESNRNNSSAIKVVPNGAIVIDVRPKQMYANWHLENALSLEWNQAISGYKSFSKANCYLICCEYGLLSGHLVEMMNKVGLEAYHLEGGISSHRKELKGFKKSQ